MHVHAVSQSSLLLSQDKAPVSSPFGTLPPKAPGHDASGDDNPFGTRKARSSFEVGSFFKIKSNKRTASAPNLGMCGQNAISLILPESEKRSISFLIHLSVHFFFSEMKVNDLGEKLIKMLPQA